MYSQLASRVSLSSSDSIEFSQAVSMAGGNAVFVEATVFSISGTDLEITVQGSNDMENWRDLTSGKVIDGVADPGYFTGSVGSVATAYVRLKYELANGSSATLAAGLNVSDQ